MQALILAGGLGTRLREEVKNVPKPMAPIAGRPFLEYLLDHLISYNIKEIVLSIGYMGEIIMKHFGNSYRNASIEYSMEETPLGTGGAILLSADKIHSERFLLLNGDTFFNLDINNFIKNHNKSSSSVSIALRKVDNTFRYGAIEMTGSKITRFKGNGIKGAGLINAGTYILDKNLITNINLASPFSFENDFLIKNCNEIRITGYPTKNYFIDIGIPEDYKYAQKQLPIIATPPQAF